jgi:phage gp16-like protein
MSTPAKRGLIGAIKAGQSHLGWDDATYRAVLARLCNGKTSSTKCSLDELQAVREYMHEQGFPASQPVTASGQMWPVHAKRCSAKLKLCLQMQNARGIMPRKCAIICFR